MNKDGRRFAKLFREARKLRDIRQCDLEAVAAQDQIEILDFDIPNPGCTACLLPSPDGYGGGIFLQPGQRPGRRRFSIAHELGHYHIPTHRRIAASCAELDLQAGEGFRRRREWEANSFAAELLMPETWFRSDARDREISFQTARELASPDMYAVSVTAAALRMVTLSRECCALVATQEGKILWQARSNFYFRIGTNGDRIRAGTAAAAVAGGEDPIPGVESVEPYAWLMEEQKEPIRLFESTHAIPTLGQVLSFLWVPDS